MNKYNIINSKNKNQKIYIKNKYSSYKEDNK